MQSFVGKTCHSASVEWRAESGEEQDTRVVPRQPGQLVWSQEVRSTLHTGSQEDPPVDKQFHCIWAAKIKIMVECANDSIVNLNR